MTIDMSQFFQVFFEEAGEHLAAMENLLLALDVHAPSDEDLNAIFRAAHSIKGGSGTFGFDDIAGVTHELETLLDRLRKHELKLTPAMVDALLEARDVIRAQLEVHRGGATEAVDAGPVCTVLRVLATGMTPPAAGVLDIEFTPEHPKARLDELFDSLSAIGNCEIIEKPARRGRRAKAGSWRLALTTGEAPEKVKELFEFVAAPEAVRVIPRNVAAADAGDDPGYGLFADAAPAPAGDPGFGLFDDSAVTQSQAAATVPVNHGRRATDRMPAIAESASIRVGIEKVDTLINLVGELVITQAMLAQTASACDVGLNEKLMNGLALLERNTRDLQESVMSIRMMPMSFVFSRFPRVVRDLAGKLDKQVELRTEGENTELDKGLIEKLADPLTHLVRNSLDHGIEMPEARVAAGKPAAGTITLRAFHQGGSIFVEVEDNGAGLSRERILAKARERGMTAPDSMSDQDVWQLIFEAGFSTAEKVTDVSGRGVGMDVVRRNIREMGGSIEMHSAPGAGTRISIRLPLTLAILDGLSVAVGDERFIIPLTHIAESLQPSAADIRSLANRARVVHVRGEYLPVVALHEVFGIQPRVREFERGIMVILEADGVRNALFVDELLGQHQVVIKSLESNYRKVHGVSGATIMGDGRVAMILDVAALVVRNPAGSLALAA